MIDVVSVIADRAERYRVVAEACQTRETWPAQIAEALQSRRRVHDRAFLVDLIQDLAEGACSVLEREFLELERRHGLPVEGTRQRPTLIQGRRAYRDIDHSQFGLVIELDGRAFHDNPRARDRDAARDLETAIAEDLRTVRLTYGQVLSNGCLTIRKVSDLLERGGWRGPFKPCSACPRAPELD